MVMYYRKVDMIVFYDYQEDLVEKEICKKINYFYLWEGEWEQQSLRDEIRNI